MNTQSFAQSSVSTHAANVSRRDDAALPAAERCVIRLPGKDIEVPVLFKTWIYDEPRSDGASLAEDSSVIKRTDPYVDIITI
jgi:hypothetical protein